VAGWSWSTVRCQGVGGREVSSCETEL
jgi:hypothetical protein